MNLYAFHLNLGKITLSLYENLPVGPFPIFLNPCSVRQGKLTSPALQETKFHIS